MIYDGQLVIIAACSGVHLDILLESIVAEFACLGLDRYLEPPHAAHVQAYSHPAVTYPRLIALRSKFERLII